VSWMRLELSYGEESIKPKPQQESRSERKLWLAAKLHVGFHFPGSSRSYRLPVVAKIKISHLENVEWWWWCTGLVLLQVAKQVPWSIVRPPLKILIWFKGLLCC